MLQLADSSVYSLVVKKVALSADCSAESTAESMVDRKENLWVDLMDPVKAD